MIFILFLAALVSADPCGDLAASRNISGSGTFAKGPVCHALFWEVARGSGPICVYTAATKDACPTAFAVLVAEAESLLASAATTEPITTTTTRAPVERPRRIDTPVVRPVAHADSETMRIPRATLRLLAFGDTGYANDELRSTMSMINRKFGDSIDAALLLGDNFYPRGVVKGLGVADPQFANVFIGVIAQGNHFPYNAVLGNHDHMGDIDAQVAFHAIEPRWNMPHYHYFKRFASQGFDTCIWFLDTDNGSKGKRAERFDRAQAEWLDASITAEKDTCRWVIVTAHHPIYTIGEYHDNKHLIENIVPIINKHGVHLYISGHEHQSQVMRNSDVSCATFLVAGCTSDQRPPYKVRNDHPLYVWSEPKHLGFLILDITSESLTYSFHRSLGGVDSEPMYSGNI